MKRFTFAAPVVAVMLLGVAAVAFAEQLYPLDPTSAATGWARSWHDSDRYIVEGDDGDYVQYVVQYYVRYEFSGLQATANYRLVGYDSTGYALLGRSFTTLGDGTASTDRSPAGTHTAFYRLRAARVAYYILWAADQDGRPIPGVPPVLSSE